MKYLCSSANFAQKYQMSSVNDAWTPADWLKYTHKSDYCIREKDMHELFVSSQQSKARNLAKYLGINIIEYKK